MRFSLQCISEGLSFQDIKMGVTFEWSDEEVNGLPKGVRSAIEIVVCNDTQLFEANKDYDFNYDEKSRHCLTITRTTKAGTGISLPIALMNVWKYYLETIYHSISDTIRYDPDCQDFGSEMIFLNHMRLVDSLLRINFYTNEFWVHRSKWCRNDFYAEFFR